MTKQDEKLEKPPTVPRVIAQAIACVGLRGLSIPNISVFSHQDDWGTWKWICAYVAPIIAGISDLLSFLFFLFDPAADGQVDGPACRAYLVLVHTWGTPLR